MLQNLLKKSKGSVMVLFIAFIPFMLAFIGLAFDFSYIYVEKTKLQNVADSAALAGVTHLKDTKTPTIGQYVSAMLRANAFTPTGNGRPSELSLESNWKMVYQKVTDNADGSKTITETTKPTEATRLKVEVIKQLPLFFLPAISDDFQSVNIKALATAQGTGTDTRASDEFDIIAFNTLRLGSSANSNGYVFIPSFPDYAEEGNPEGRPIPKDLYNYKDFGQSMTKNIYANIIEFKKGSVIRADSWLLTSSPNTSLIGTNIFMKDVNKYTTPAGTKFTLTKIDTIATTIADEGRTIAKDARTNSDYKAILVPVTGERFNANDWWMGGKGNDSSMRSKYPSYFDDLEVLQPVVFYSPTNKPFVVDMAISFFCFQQPIIIDGGSLSMAGSQTPDTPNNGFGVSTKKFTQFDDIYCFASSNATITTPPSGIFTLLAGQSAPKEFKGIIYTDAKMDIQTAKDYRRHIFRKTLISRQDIEFGTDHFSTSPKDTANYFDSLPVGSKIMLVQ